MTFLASIRMANANLYVCESLWHLALTFSANMKGNIILNQLLVQHLGIWFHGDKHDKISHQNLTYKFITLPFVYALNITAASGLVFLLCI